MEPHIVNIDQGRLKGKICDDYYGKPYLSFQGIPYAQPPIGALRFKPPQAPQSWTGIRNANIEGNDCYSRHWLHGNVVGSEDCLYLNVYTPDLTKAKPVMFWIHGGGFLTGSGSTESYGPDFLIHEDVVVVTINYRLGIFGFLSLEDSSLGVPGNMGLKDQVMALQWVQSNINKFGGDPNNVTIFGQSVGGAAVHYLMLSPKSKGLFHKAIIQSGSAISSRGRGQYSTPLIRTALELPQATDADILNMLLNMSTQQLFEIQDKIPEYYYVSQFRKFGVVVEPFLDENTFLFKEPLEIIKSKEYHQVPLLIGYTSREGYFAKTKYNVDSMQGDFEKEILFSLNTKKGTNLSTNVANKIKQFFYGNGECVSSNSDAFFLLQSDNMFIRPVYNAARLHVATSSFPAYLYRISIDSKLNTLKDVYNLITPGVCHADELGYLFKNTRTPEQLPPGSVEENGIKTMTKYWTTFAKTGNPNPSKKHPLINVTWQPIESDKMHFVDIGENITIGINPETSRMKFWQEIEDMCSVSYK